MNNIHLNDIIEKHPKGECLSEFTCLLQSEIRKVYTFYIRFEKNLYIEINKHLHKKSKYKILDIIELKRELKKFIVIINLCMNFSTFIYINMKYLQQILHKFDSKFNSVYGNISNLFILNNTENKYSDLNYIIAYNILNETSALIDYLTNTISVLLNAGTINSKNSRESFIEKFNDLNRESEDMKIKLVENSKLENSEIQIKFEHVKHEDVIKLEKLERKQCENYIHIILYKLDLLDELEEKFRIIIQPWDQFYLFKTTENNNLLNFYDISSEKERSLRNVSLSLSDNKVVEKNISDTEVLSSMNQINIQLSLFHTFFYQFLYFISQPTNSEYLNKMGIDSSLNGLIMAATPIAAIFSVIIFSVWSNRSYKMPMIVTLLCFVLGNLLYSLAFHFKSGIIVWLGRLIIGFGSGRTINRRYLIAYIPIEFATKYSFLYVFLGTVGVAFGPGLSILLGYLPSTNISIFYFNEYTYPGWIGFFSSIIFLIIIILGYQEPLHNPKFIPFSQNYRNNHSEIEKRKSSINQEMNQTAKIQHSDIQYDQLVINRISGIENNIPQDNENNSLRNSINENVLLSAQRELNKINEEVGTLDLVKKHITKIEVNSWTNVKNCIILMTFCLIMCRVKILI